MVFKTRAQIRRDKRLAELEAVKMQEQPVIPVAYEPDNKAPKRGELWVQYFDERRTAVIKGINEVSTPQNTAQLVVYQDEKGVTQARAMQGFLKAYQKRVLAKR